MASVTLDLGSGTTGAQGPQGVPGDFQADGSIPMTGGLTIDDQVSSTPLEVLNGATQLFRLDNTGSAVVRNILYINGSDLSPTSTVLQLPNAAMSNDGQFLTNRVCVGLPINDFLGSVPAYLVTSSADGITDMFQAYLNDESTIVAKIDALGNFTAQDITANSLSLDGDNFGRAAAVADIADPSTATAEDCANKINELLASLRASGLMSV